ncbi:hypothetical protein CALCODRAFT_485719 [Calocera cornea HHB12733]|uniref:Mid2 domain-containing protein n=1 Tax=Calocera cornea HHB12733 TaxID=1353952 RepID=A0A165E6H0_9BASI|nr:hypothetical protein CALCODRAFT_485719 [Calocera cornea HHB12733]
MPRRRIALIPLLSVLLLASSASAYVVLPHKLNPNTRAARIARSQERLERRQGSETSTAWAPTETKYNTYNITTSFGTEVWQCLTVLTPTTSSTGEMEYEEDQSCTFTLVTDNNVDPSTLPPPVIPSGVLTPASDPLATVESVLSMAPTTTLAAAGGVVTSVDAGGMSTFLIPASAGGAATSLPAAGNAAPSPSAAAAVSVSTESIIMSIDSSGSTTFLMPAGLFTTAAGASAASGTGTTLTVTSSMPSASVASTGNEGAGIVASSSIDISQLATATASSSSSSASSSVSADPTAQLSSILYSSASATGEIAGNQGASIVAASSIDLSSLGATPSVGIPPNPSSSVGASQLASILADSAPSSAATNTVLPANAGALTSSNDTTSAAAVAIPGQSIQVLPIGLGVFAGIMVITLIVVGIVTFERTQYRKAFRARKMAEQGGAMGYGGMAERA